MNQNNLAIAEAYYKALGEKNIVATENYLDMDVQCTGPLVQVVGREMSLRLTKNLFLYLKP